MVPRALTSFALGLALAACDGAEPNPATPAGLAQGKSGEAADRTDDGPDGQAVPSDDPVGIRPAPALPDTWTTFSSKADGFEVRLPAAPKTQTLEVPNPHGGTLSTTVYMTGQGTRTVGVGVLTVPADALAAFDIDGAIDEGRDGLVKNIGGTLVSDEQVEFAGHPAHAVVANSIVDGAAVQLEARVFFAKPRLYQLLVIRVKSEPFPTEKFFESFSLLND